MKTCSGVFNLSNDAFLAARDLATQLGTDRVNILTPDDPAREVEEVPTTEDMPPVGGAIGGVLGGALGVGTALAIPGIGPILSFGLAAAGLIVGGGLGWAAGDTADEKSFTGMPADELYVYRDALIRGRTVVVTLIHKPEEEVTAKAVFQAHGAEAIEAARKQWWLGLRSAEKEAYHADEDFDRDEPVFHVGFEAGCATDLRGLSFDEAEDVLRSRFPNLYDEKAFRTGYERAQIYVRKFERWRREMPAELMSGGHHA